MYTTDDVLSKIHNKIQSKITIIEGPDSVGKTTLLNKIKDVYKDSPIAIKSLRFPDNREDSDIRKVLFSKTLKDYPSAQAFLFMADFILGYEMGIKPYMDDPNVKFVFDRFLPSTCVYQRLDIAFVNSIFSQYDSSFYDSFSTANYIYLNPVNIDDHLKRISSRNGDDVNHFDPEKYEDIIAQTEAYQSFSHLHKELGLVGSHQVTVVDV